MQFCKHNLKSEKKTSYILSGLSITTNNRRSERHILFFIYFCAVPQNSDNPECKMQAKIQFPLIPLLILQWGWNGREIKIYFPFLLKYLWFWFKVGKGLIDKKVLDLEWNQVLWCSEITVSEVYLLPMGITFSLVSMFTNHRIVESFKL